MGALTQVYIDPAIAADSGTGTIGDPYGDTQYALNTKARDTTNGDQFNIKAGTSEILAAALSFTTYGTPTATAPLVIRGYTSAANDGGQGVVSGNGSLACINNGALGHIALTDMRFTNCGSAAIVTLGGNCLALNCEFDTTTGSGLSFSTSPVINCYFHNISTSGVASAARVLFCTFRNETNDFTQAIQAAGAAVIAFNLIDIDGASHGIAINGDSAVVMFNSIYSNGGTGAGIRNPNGPDEHAIVLNNTVQGFSGAGGIGILLAGANSDISGYNLVFNNTTNVSITGDCSVDLGNNDAAGSGPFVNAASDDFDPIAGLLASYPSYPTTWNNYASTQQNLIRMAAQYAAGGASGGVLLGSMRGGFTN